MDNKLTLLAFTILFGFSSGVIVTALDVSEAQAQTKRKKKSSQKAIGSVKAGLVGSGEATLSSNGSSTSLSDSNNFTLGGFALFPVAPGIRVGPSLAYYPSIGFTSTTDSPSFSSPDGSEEAYGFDLNVMGEYTLPMSGFDGFGFLELGYSSVIPGAGGTIGDLSGYSIGGGAGAQFLMNRKMAVRGDLKVTHYELEGSIPDEANSTPAKLSGNRVMLNIGVVFAL